MIGLGFLGFFTAIYHPVGLPLVTDMGLRTGRALAINGVFGNLGLAGAAIMTAMLAQYFGWQSAFAVPGLISIAVGARLYLRHKTNQIHQNAQSTIKKQATITSDRRTQLIVFGIICVMALFG